MMRTTVVATTTFRSERLRWVAALCMSTVVGCSGCDESSDAPAQSASAAAADLSAVPAPEGLLAELFVPTPGTTWRSLRDTAGVPLLPQSYGVLLATVLGLPPTVAEAFDDAVVTTGAVAVSPTRDLLVVLGAHVRSGPEFVANLTTGDAARFDARRDDSTNIVHLVAKPGKASTEVALGVLGNRLLFARSTEELNQLGPYVGRSLHRRDVKGSGVFLDVPRSAMKGPIATEVEARWKEARGKLDVADQENRKKHGGRAPDFGDPQAALLGLSSSVDTLLEVLKTAESARITLDSEAGVVRLRADIAPGSSPAAHAWVSGLSPGSAKPLLNLPKNAVGGVLLRSSEAGRTESAESTSETLGKLFGDRLGAADAKKVTAAFSQLAMGRGDEAVLGLSVAPPSGLSYRGTVADPKAFDAGARALFALLDLPALREPLRQFAGEMTVKRSPATVVGITSPIQRTLLTIKPSAMRLGGDPTSKVSAEAQPIDILWTQKDGVAHGAASTDAVPLLVKLITQEPAETWAALPGATKAVERLGERASFVLALRPGTLLPRAGTDADGVATFALGKTENRPWLELALDQEAVRAAIKSGVLQR